MSSFDVVVIGAGIHGASAAYHLAAGGSRTLIVERDAPAAGPTGRSSAICRAYYTNEILARAARDSIEMMERFTELTGGDASFRRTGLLFVHPPEDVEAVGEHTAMLGRLGIATETLDRDALAERFGCLNLDGIAVGVWEINAGYADPAGATWGLFRRAIELGAEARLGKAAERIQAGAPCVVVTSDGERIECDRVLIAAGPWTAPLARQVGADLPLTVERHAVGMIRRPPGEDIPGHGDLVGGHYLRLEGEELLLVGTLHPTFEVDPDRFDETATDDEIAGICASVVRRVPVLEGAEIRGGWASLYDVSPDWQPVIGEVAPGVFVDAGTSGHGFKLAPALGRHVAALVAGDPAEPGLADFDPGRFSRGILLDAGWRRARILG